MRIHVGLLLLWGFFLHSGNFIVQPFDIAGCRSTLLQDVVRELHEKSGAEADAETTICYFITPESISQLYCTPTNTSGYYVNSKPEFFKLNNIDFITDKLTIKIIKNDEQIISIDHKDSVFIMSMNRDDSMMAIFNYDTIYLVDIESKNIQHVKTREGENNVMYIGFFSKYFIVKYVESVEAYKIIKPFMKSANI